MGEHDVAEPAYPSYPEPSAFDARVGRAEYERRLALAAAAVSDPIELLVRLPFQPGRSLHRAGSGLGLRSANARSTLDFVRRELGAVAGRLLDRRRLSRLHLAGTPAFYAPSELRGFLADLASRFPPLPCAELTVELDPRTTTEAHLDAFASFGFDRAWIGVEDYAPPPAGAAGGAAVGSDGSTTGFELTARALGRARRAGFSTLAADLVCGLPHHTAESFDAAAAVAIALGFDRVAIRPAARHDARARGIDAAARERLERAGYQPIGLDTFARATDALATARRAGTLRRALGGWTAAYAGDCVVGLGAGAVSEAAGASFENARRLDAYEAALVDWRLPIERGLVRHRDDDVRRRVVCDLVGWGVVDTAEIEGAFGIDFAAYFADDLARLEPLLDEDLVRVRPGAIEVRPAGRLAARALAECFDRRRRESPPRDNTLPFARRRGGAA